MGRDTLVINAVKEDIIPGDDGFYIYWPNSKGALTSQDLRIIADWMDAKNEPMQKSIEDYFKENNT